ncbi:MAG TPA: hypothetical protein VGH37_15475 [Candidatus Acidoferrum sp.]|jgi:hypothetical protein
MLNLKIVRGPLQPEQNEAILFDYNRLTNAVIPMNEFVHWVQNGPMGPAWHAILETDEKQIVGHTSLIPLRTPHGAPNLVPAKSEYSFVHEDFRSMPIRKFESVKRAKFLILVDQLFQHGKGLGWDPIFVSTREANHPLSRRVGCKQAEFPLWECILIHRPVGAARHTPNLKRKQRAALLVAGVSQQVTWPLLSFTLSKETGIHPDAIDRRIEEPNSAKLSFFEDQESLRWRYLEGQYARFGFDDTPGDYVIAKRGSEEKYVRVCQWQLTSAKCVDAVLLALVRNARQDNAIGVRWAVYDNEAMAPVLVNRMRKLGFLCARRSRTLMINTSQPGFYAASEWRVNDSLVSFDP